MSNWFLQGTLKDNSPWNIQIDKEEFTIGRLETCDLIISSHLISRKHGIITAHRQELYLTDLNSKNGTFVNGVRINTETKLKDQDIISFGPQEFTIQYSETNDLTIDKTLIDEGKESENDFVGKFHISKREEEVLYFLLKGKSIKEIAGKLFISPGTAKNHALKIYKKTGCHTRIELATCFNDYIQEK